MRYYRIRNSEYWQRESSVSYHFLKEVKVRKDHKCEVCGRIIKKGELALKFQYGHPMDMYAYYYCSNCYEKREDKEDDTDA